MSKETFREAVFNWIGDAATNTSPECVNFSTRKVWLKQSEGQFSTQDVSVAAWAGAFFDVVQRLPTWRLLTPEATTWPALKEHLSNNCGCIVSVGSIYADLGLLMRPFLPAPAMMDAARQSMVMFNKTTFERLFENFAQFIESDAMRFRFVTVIAGLRVPDESLPLVLSADGVVLERLSPSLIDMFGAFGMIRGHIAMGAQGPYDDPNRPWLALQWNASFGKITRSNGNQNLSKANGDENAEIHAIREAFLGALVLVEFGSAFLGSTARIQEDWDIGGYSFTLNDKVPDVRQTQNTTKLAAPALAELSTLFSRLRRLPQRADEKLATAIRRLIFASENLRPEDRLLDGMIAVEAILGESTEIRYKIALRCAFLLEPTSPSKRRIIFDDMQNAYDVRSKLVHGSKPNANDLTIGGKRVTLPEFVRAIENHIRRAVKEIVLKGTFPVWNDLIIGQ